MKTFNNFKDAMKWVTKDVIQKGTDDVVPAIAEQVYKDSNEFTYRESGEMYQSGERNSDFQNGIIIERTPYVRRRYYEGGKPGAGNRNAQKKWFEKTINKYSEEYNQMIVNSINKAKKGK